MGAPTYLEPRLHRLSRNGVKCGHFVGTIESALPAAQSGSKRARQVRTDLTPTRPARIDRSRPPGPGHL